jgi:hypothetical protein
MSTAVLISGQMRTGRQCLPSIRRHVLDRIGAHLVYIHAAADEDADQVELFAPRFAKVEKQPDLDEKNYVHRTGRGVYGVQPVLRQLWSLREAWRLMEQHAGPRPDWVVRLRPDCEFTAPMEFLPHLDGYVQPPTLWVPTFHNFHGLCDRFAFGGYEAMKVYCERFDNLDAYVAAGGIFQPETHLAWTLAQAGVAVKRTQALFNLRRKNGEVITPSWNQGAFYGDTTPHV